MSTLRDRKEYSLYCREVSIPKNKRRVFEYTINLIKKGKGKGKGKKVRLLEQK
jgi:hypothetical protein